MKKSILILFVVLLGSCELIVIGTPSYGPRIVEIDQKSSIGAVYLFKAELDSNNIPAASQILANPDGRFYLAFEKYEMYYDIHRLQRILNNKSITNIFVDSLSSNKKKYKFEFNYLDTMAFTTRKINEDWYITDISNWNEITSNQIKIINNRN
jgi:hypothetical protein